MHKIAITGDYHGLAMRLADWSALGDRCAITVFGWPLAVAHEAVELSRSSTFPAPCANAWRRRQRCSNCCRDCG